MSVPLSEARSFTEAYTSQPPRQSVLQRLRSFNSSLVNVLPRSLKHFRRMAWREGMVKVTVPGQGWWYLDVQDCELLEGWDVLSEVMLPREMLGDEGGGGLMRWFRT